MPTINRKQHYSKQIQYKHNNKSDKYYSSSLWTKLRNYYIVHHPLCEECLKNDKITPALHVHHITPFLRGKTNEERFELLLNENNLMSVCIDCHHKLHKLLKKF